ncbi:MULTISPECIES: hypothetical protein [unclassified Haloferax]|jgi:hypothetical protein|uniref:hypothetical protein n=1 Tax=unclassified Haloferax TaxID=2625095 RepID=UPI00287723EC|nr:MULTISPECIES: hypothetical protein [unclassified Haloferax]MDS0243068.1 hypothetical protein [Haloferax sp. S2CR25]MDS0446189.1 hypothetical protein [Haloferax sp. S2CR25-2]
MVRQAWEDPQARASLDFRSGAAAREFEREQMLERAPAECARCGGDAARDVALCGTCEALVKDE